MNSIEIAWKNFLKEAFDDGEWQVKDDGDEILEIRDNHCFISNLLDTMFYGEDMSLNMFLDLIDKGLFNIEEYPIKSTALKSYVMSLDDDEQIYLDDYDVSFVYTYPERLLNVKQVTREDEIVYSNQVDTIINRLKNDDGSNRAVANLYMCSLDKDEQHIPCLNFVQALIRDDELSLHIMFRSNDLYTAFPSNMFFIHYLGLKIVDALKDKYPLLHFKGIYYNSSSLHIYKGDYEQAKKVV